MVSEVRWDWIRGYWESISTTFWRLCHLLWNICKRKAHSNPCGPCLYERVDLELVGSVITSCGPWTKPRSLGRPPGVNWTWRSGRQFDSHLRSRAEVDPEGGALQRSSTQVCVHERLVQNHLADVPIELGRRTHFAPQDAGVWLCWVGGPWTVLNGWNPRQSLTEVMDETPHGPSPVWSKPGPALDSSHLWWPKKNTKEATVAVLVTS